MGISGSYYCVYTISDTGVVTFLYNKSWTGGSSMPHWSVIHPSGRFFYGIANDGSNLLTLIPIIAGGADLDDANKIGYVDTIGGTNHNIYLHPNGQFLYSMISSTIVCYSINQSSGALSKIGSYVLGTAPAMAAFHPYGGWMYVTHPSTNLVSVLNVDNATGLISYNSSFAVGNNPNYIAIALVSSKR